MYPIWYHTRFYDGNIYEVEQRQYDNNLTVEVIRPISWPLVLGRINQHLSVRYAEMCRERP